MGWGEIIVVYILNDEQKWGQRGDGVSDAGLS